MSGMAAYRALAAQWRRALPRKAQHFYPMRLAEAPALSRHSIAVSFHQRAKRCRADAIRAASGLSVALKLSTSAQVDPSADRQAVQIHSDSSIRRRRGLQSHKQTPSHSRNGTQAGQSIPNKDSRSDSSDRPYSPAKQQSDAQHNSTPRQANGSQDRSTDRPPGSQSRPCRESYMPPHLFTPRRPPLQATNGQHKAGAQPPVEPPEYWGSKIETEQLTARLPPSDVTGFEDKAEGAIQIGASGIRIPLYGRTVQSIKEAMQKEAAGTSFEGRAMGSEDSLSIADRKTGKAHERLGFDWSGSTNYTRMNRETLEQRAQWLASKTNGSTEKVRMTVGGDVVGVLPLWIAVKQSIEGGLARLHESNVPLSEDVVEELEVELEPFCYTAGLKFETCDERVGHWRNFFIGIIGSVDAQEEDVLWPNQVIHENRTLYNCRNGWDIGRFLADATKEDVDNHLFNLKRLQEERQYRPGWCYHHLRMRWGEGALREFGISVNE